MYHEQAPGNGVPAEVLFDIVGDPTDYNDAGVTYKQGTMGEVQLGPDITRIPVMKLRGLKQNPNQPVVFKVTSSGPQTLMGASDSGTGEIQLTEAVGASVTMMVWEGEEVGKKGMRLTIVADQNGIITGTVSDAEISYMIETTSATRNSNGAIPLKYTAVTLKDLPAETDPEGMRRQLEQKHLRGGVEEMNDDNDATQRELQTTPTVTIGLLVSQKVINYFNTYGFQGSLTDALNRWRLLLQTDTRRAMSISGIAMTVNVSPAYLYTALTDPVGAAGGSFLTSVYNTGVYSWQDTNRFDVVAVIGENVYSGQASSIGPFSFAGSSGRRGYFEAKRSIAGASGQWTFIHEFGHILNARHDPLVDSSCRSYDNCGYVFESNCMRTLMAYPNRCWQIGCTTCSRSLEFSRYTGAYADFNNARSIRNYAPTVAAFK
jgi:hypothetical protein